MKQNHVLLIMLLLCMNLTLSACSTGIHESRIINASPYEGSTEYQSGNFRYMIYVDELDISSQTITIRALVNFLDEDVTDIHQVEPIALDLEYMKSIDEYWFSLDTSSTGYWANAITFCLNADGLHLR